MNMTKQKGICEECKVEYEYEYNPKFPRKYCPDCSAKKKQEYEDNNVLVEKPGQPIQSVNPFPNKNLTMYVSYAKDIFVAMINNNQEQVAEKHKLMMNATDLVKQAMKELQ